MDTATEHPRILIVDDDAMTRLLAQQTLRQGGYTVLMAADAAEGLALFERERPDLLLLDVVMPGMDGFTACDTLRRNPAAAYVPIIMLTGLDDTESIHRAYEVGATDFITKPINWPLLTYRVRYALRANRTLSELARSQASLASAQRIARLGSWEWRIQNNTAQRSEEYSRIVGTVPESDPRAVLDKVHPEDRPAVERALRTAVDEGIPYELNFRVIRPDGTLRTVYEQVEVLRDEHGNVDKLEGITQDITERVQAKEKIHYLAYYDNLTGLANRELFRKMAEAALQRALRQHTHCALLFLDIDRFKRINDTLTHVVGDQLLKAVAERLVHCVRASGLTGAAETAARNDPIARPGGDEFTILLTDLVNPEDSAKVARRILEAVAHPIDLGPQQVTVTVSIGVALYPLDASNFEALLKNADTAMYSAKDHGRNNYQFYSKAMNASAFERLSLENDLRKAVSEEQLLLYYQPKVDAQSGALIGAEALLRWLHPERGLVSPAEFIPIAEETGLIVPIGNWVIRTVCEQVGRWQRAGLAPVPVAVNLAAPNFRQIGLAGLIEMALAKAQLEPHMLELEVTESILMRDLDTTVKTLERLKSMGLTLAIDDFGTGYSSLSYLKRFPIDALKIDRSFIRDVVSNPNDAAIAVSIIALAKNLDLDVVAEGVETEQQADFLMHNGCTTMQGFLYAKPLPVADFEALLADGGRRSKMCDNRRLRLAVTHSES